MASFSFLHAADLHLDTPFQGIAAEAPEVRELLVNASLRCWDALVSLAIERRVAFVLLAGDLYDGIERGVRAQLRVKAGLDRLSAAGIRTCIVHGNHDPLDGWGAAGQFASEVTVFGSSEVGTVAITRDGETLATVYGISFGTPAVEENLALRFRRGDAGGLHIGLLHCTVGADSEHARYSPCTIEDLRIAGMDYWALGHIHKRHVLSSGTPWVVYPGNLQGRSAKPSEQGEKGAFLVHVVDGVITEPEFIPLDCVRFIESAIPITDLADMAALHDAVLERMEEWRQAHQGRGLIVRVILRGRGPLHGELARVGELDELTRALRDEAVRFQPLLWIEAVRDETGAALDRDAIQARGDFCAELLRHFDELKDDPVALRAIGDQQMPAALRRRLAALGIQMHHDHLMAMLERAESMALDLLDVEAVA